MAGYESDVTKFIRELISKNPDIAEDQRRARARWWDKPVDFEEQRRYREARVPVRGYYYYPLPEPVEGGESSPLEKPADDAAKA
ncbi:MAG TPA: DUF3460 family protein [Pelomicrobium sp.]|nr:DUF3460 family protein [Pelomicrobium sp.]